MSDVLQVVLSPSAVTPRPDTAVSRAGERFDEMCDIVVASVFAALPEFRVGRPASDQHDMRLALRRATGIGLSLVADGRSLDSDERRTLRLIGGQWARQGISRASLVDGVKVMTRACLAFLMTCAVRDGDVEALTGALCRLATLVSTFEDEAVAALALGHDEARLGLLSGGDKGEALLVDRLLERRFVDAEEVLGHAAHVGLSRTRAAYVVVATTAHEVGDASRLQAAATALRSRVLLAVGPVRTDGRIHVPLIVQPATHGAWDDVLDDLERIACAHEVTFVRCDAPTTLTAVVDSYRPIRDSLAYLLAVTRSPGTVRSLLLRFQQAVCAGAQTDRVELVREVFEPLEALPDRERSELFATLDSLYETGGSSATLARHLHLHKNTVANRLRRVGTLTGLDMRRPAERLVLEVLARVRHVSGVGV